jgi:hypothetical protein
MDSVGLAFFHWSLEETSMQNFTTVFLQIPIAKNCKFEHIFLPMGSMLGS